MGDNPKLEGGGQSQAGGRGQSQSGGRGQSQVGGRVICGVQYIGSTTEMMSLRHASHRTEIKQRSTPLGRHFAICGLEHFSLQIIDCVKEGEEAALEILEGFWSHRLATFRVHGNINSRNEMTRNRRR